MGKQMRCCRVFFFFFERELYWYINGLNISFMYIQRGLTEPFVDDGLLEVVGFRDAWHGLVLYAPKGHGTRLAQVMFP